MPTAHAASIDDAAECVQERPAIASSCAVADDDATELHDADLTGGLLIVIGGERRGVTRSFVSRADCVIRIGYGRDAGA